MDKGWKPIEDKTPKLKFYNSITKQVDDFYPRTGNTIKWYVCGPTVYDSSHLGHARTYISFDVIRRVLENYFGYEVVYVMNITDIDDKIINRAVEKGIECSELTIKFENEFFEDMKSLNVKRPNIVTRATEYIEKIKLFIEKLEQMGYAYEANGSVYFDLEKYKETYSYPIFVGMEAIDDTETETEKKNRADFVLWKKSEKIFYDSKWGRGRPGWHIECSTMASDVLGDLDIHSGGIDLAFPHHENETVQSQACLGIHRWTNYFLHTGHLHIKNCKMSKSLKNFITIKDLLKNGSKGVRMLFLMHNWNTNMDYNEEALEYAKTTEKKIFNFISVSEAIFKRENTETKKSEEVRTEVEKMSIKEKETLSDQQKINEMIKNNLKTEFSISDLIEIQSKVHSALCDNINTRKVVDILCEMITRLNKEIGVLNLQVHVLCVDYIKKIMFVFGMIVESKQNDSGIEVAELLCEFRAKVRCFARSKADSSEFFKLCDDVRIRASEKGYLIEDLGKESTVRIK